MKPRGKGLWSWQVPEKHRCIDSLVQVCAEAKSWPRNLEEAGVSQQNKGNFPSPPR